MAGKFQDQTSQRVSEGFYLFIFKYNNYIVVIYLVLTLSRSIVLSTFITIWDKIQIQFITMQNIRDQVFSLYFFMFIVGIIVLLLLLYNYI